MPEPSENPITLSLRKRVTWLALTFLFLLVVAILLEGPWSARRKSRPRTVTLLTVVDTSRISQFFVKQDKDSVYLRKIQGTWMVFEPGDSIGYKADHDAVRRALDRMREIRGNVVSSKPEKYSLFEVSDSQAVRVTVWGAGDKEIGELYFGKSGPDLSSTYVRGEGKPEVILADGFLRSYFFGNLNRWRNRKIVSFKPEEVSKFAVYFKKEGDSLIVEKKPSGWVLSSGEIADSTKVRQSIRYLSNLRALGFGDTLSEEETGLGNPDALIRTTLKDGRVYTVYVGKKLEKPERYVVMTDGDNSVYLTSKFTMERLLRPAEEYLPPPKEEKRPEDKKENPKNRH